MYIAFGFAWVNEEDNVFLPEYFREDEVTVKSFSREHNEGENPKFTIVFRNPLEGPLAPGRKQWAWVSYHRIEPADEENDIEAIDEIVPICFGKLIPIPNDLIGERITYQFDCKASDQEEQMQDIAETLKTLPNYDRVFIDANKADDPNTVLEGYPRLWHVDPIRLEVTTSDIIVGEDGVEVFLIDDDEVPYNSVKEEINQNPQSVVQIIADVGWTQSAEGGTFIETGIFQTYTGDGFIGDWPKPLATLGDGWTVTSSVVNDTNHIADSTSISLHAKWENHEKEHINGDTLLVDTAVTIPSASGITAELTHQEVIGLLDPYSDPQVNRAASLRTTSVTVPLWTVSGSMHLAYKAARDRTERLRFTLRSDLQIEESGQPEVISKSGNDVGQPMINALNWLSIKGKPVVIGTVIVVDTEFTASVFQVAIQAGTAGLIEPEFSDTFGVATTDGTVIWVAMGDTALNETPDWLPNAITTTGQRILPKPPRFTLWDTIIPPVPPPVAGVAVPEGLILKRRNGASFQQVRTAGTTGIIEPNFNDTRGATTADNTVTWVSLGPVLPGSAALQLCTTPGTTGLLEPVFGTTSGATTNDNTVVWTSLGTSGVMIGPAIGDLSSSSYFASDRGQDSIKYLLNFGRAKLLAASRAVRITFDVPFARAVPITLRKNGWLFDRRIPGDLGAYGKIVSCVLTVDGGRRFGTITIACSVGNGGTVEDVEGENVYIDDYIDAYYAEEGGTLALDTGDIGYSRPVYKAVDDKLVFPLSDSQSVVGQPGVRGASLAEQVTAINTGLAAQVALAQLPEGSSVQQSIANEFSRQQLSKTSVSGELAKVPRWYEIELVSLGGNFSYQYDIETTVLKPPKQIDLAALAV